MPSGFSILQLCDYVINLYLATTILHETTHAVAVAAFKMNNNKPVEGFTGSEHEPYFDQQRNQRNSQFLTISH